MDLRLTISVGVRICRGYLQVKLILDDWVSHSVNGGVFLEWPPAWA